MGLAPDGTIRPQLFDSSGHLIVAVTGAGSGGTSSVDSTAFQVGTTAGTPTMGAVNPSDTVANGDVAIAALDGQRNTKVNVVAGSVAVTPTTSSAATSPTQTSVPAGSATLIFAANASAKGRGIQNVGPVPVYLGFGAAPVSPPSAAYHRCLASSGASDDGFGGYWDGTVSGVIYQGNVYAITKSGGGGLVAPVQLT